MSKSEGRHHLAGVQGQGREGIRAEVRAEKRRRLRSGNPGRRGRRRISSTSRRNGKRDGQVVTEIVDNVRAGVTIPYSPEFAEMESNPGLLKRLSAETGGQNYSDNDPSLQDAIAKAAVFRPVPESLMSLQPLWPWMVALAAVCLLFDVAIRRIAVQPEAVWTKAAGLWQRVRRRHGAGREAARIHRAVEEPQGVGRRIAGQAEGGEEIRGGGRGSSRSTRRPLLRAPPPEKPKPPRRRGEAEEAGGATISPRG